MSEVLTWIVLSGTILTVVLIIVSLVRWPQVFEKAARVLRDELRMGREEAQKTAREHREEISSGLRSANETLSTTLATLGKLQQTQLDGMATRLRELTESNQSSLDRIRTTVDSRVKELQEGNEKKLEDMRKTVDDRLVPQVGDFRLFSRAAVSAIRQFREQHRFLRGMVAWLGLKEAVIPFERQVRAQELAGEAVRVLGDFLRRSSGDNITTRVAALRPQINQIIGHFDDV